MVTKGIIKSIDFNGNSCIVRMPYFETAGSSEVICEALISNVPGIYNGYKENDVVWVAFEDGSMETPVVIGKLYLGASKEKQDPRGTVNCVDSSISGSATIPSDTKLNNDLAANQINTTIPYQSLKSIANNLTRVDTEQAQNNRDLGNRLKTVVDGIGPDGSKIYSLIEQTTDRITNVVGRKVDSESGTGTLDKAFGWDLTENYWRVFATSTVNVGEEAEATKVVSILVKDGEKNIIKTYVIVNGVRVLELTDANKALLNIGKDETDFTLTAVCVEEEGNHVWKVHKVGDENHVIITDTLANTKTVLTVTEDGLVVNGSGEFNGNGTFTGDITATKGAIGKFIIGDQHYCNETHNQESGIYSVGYIDAFEDNPEEAETDKGVYVGTDGIKLGTNFSVDINGKVIASDIVLSGAAKREFAGVTGNLQDGNRNGVNNAMLIIPTDLAEGNPTSNGPLSLSKIKNAISDEILLTKSNISTYFVNQSFIFDRYNTTTPGICKYLKMQDVKDKLLANTTYTYSFKARLRSDSGGTLNPNIYCALIATKTDNSLEVIGGKLTEPTLWRNGSSSHTAISTAWKTGYFTFTTANNFNNSDYKSINLFIIIASWGISILVSGVEPVEFNQIKLETGDTYTDFTYSASDQLGSFTGIALSITRSMNAAGWKALTKGIGVQDQLAGSSGEVGILEPDAAYLLTGVATDTHDTYTVFCKCLTVDVDDSGTETITGIVLSNTCQEKGETFTSIVKYYYQGTTKPNPPSTASDWEQWNTTLPTPVIGKSIWSLEKASLDDGTFFLTEIIEETALSDIYALAQGKSTNYYGSVAPSNAKEGDCWFVTDYCNFGPSNIKNDYKNNYVKNGNNYILITSNNIDNYVTVGTTNIWRKGALMQRTSNTWVDISGEMIANKVTANYINAMDITAKKLTVLDTNNQPLLLADSDTNTVSISDFEVSSTALHTKNFNPTITIEDPSAVQGVYVGTNGIKLGNSFLVDASGSINASKGNFGGNVRARSLSSCGAISGESLNINDSLIIADNMITVPNTAKVTLGNTTITSSGMQFNTNNFKISNVSEHASISFVDDAGTTLTYRLAIGSITGGQYTWYIPITWSGTLARDEVITVFVSGFDWGDRTKAYNLRLLAGTSSATLEVHDWWSVSSASFSETSTVTTKTITQYTSNNNMDKLFIRGVLTSEAMSPTSMQTNETYRPVPQAPDTYCTYHMIGIITHNSELYYEWYGSGYITQYRHAYVYTKKSDGVAAGTPVYDSSFNSITTIESSVSPTAAASIGTSSNYWPVAYVTTLYTQSGGVESSDKNAKYDINYNYDLYDKFYDSIKPANFKYINGESGRNHLGFIAQDIKDSLDKFEIDTQNFAGYCEWPLEDQTTCGLRYIEFIALNVNQIQKLKKRMTELEEKIEKLEKGE